VFNARGAEIAKELSDVLGGDGPGSLQLNDELVFDKDVSEEVPKQCTVLIEDIQRVLLEGAKSLFAEAAGKAVFVYSFDMAVAEMAVESEAGLTNLVTELKDWVLHLSFFPLAESPNDSSSRPASNEPRQLSRKKAQKAQNGRVIEQSPPSILQSRAG